MSLYLATRDLHHACEAHPVGQRMSAGIITRQEWADWLEAFRVIHITVDPILPPHMTREGLLRADLALLPAPRSSDAAWTYAASLATQAQREGAAYVLHGAHRRGGAMLARTMGAAGLPTAHVAYPMPAEAETFVRGCRERDDLAEPARATFAALLAVMDEIETNTRSAHPKAAA
jgi:hypothetical protein